MKNNSLFEMDGLVILANTPYIRVTEEILNIQLLLKSEELMLKKQKLLL